MARLTPAELQAARVRSGHLGGRPRKPSVDEAREAALDRLMPQALRVLEAHLGTPEAPNPEGWRAAIRVFEHRFGRAPDQRVEPNGLPDDPAQIEALSWSRLQLLAAQLIEVPPGRNQDDHSE